MQCITDCRGWLERESRHGLQQGQNWFLISMLWWQQWKDYVKYVSWTEERLFRRIVWHLTMRIVFVSLYYMTLVYGVPVIQHRNRECTACINLKYHFKQWQGSPCYCLTIQEHKGIVVEQPSILSSLRTPTATEPTPPERVGVLGTFSPVSPTEERSPDAVSSASEATETGDPALFSYHSRPEADCYSVATVSISRSCLFIPKLQFVAFASVNSTEFYICSDSLCPN